MAVPSSLAIGRCLLAARFCSAAARPARRERPAVRPEGAAAARLCPPNLRRRKPRRRETAGSRGTPLDRGELEPGLGQRSRAGKQDRADAMRWRVPTFAARLITRAAASGEGLVICDCHGVPALWPAASPLYPGPATAVLHRGTELPRLPAGPPAECALSYHGGSRPLRSTRNGCERGSAGLKGKGPATTDLPWCARHRRRSLSTRAWREYLRASVRPSQRTLTKAWLPVARHLWGCILGGRARCLRSFRRECRRQETDHDRRPF